MAWSGEEPLKSEQVAESVNTNPVVIRRSLKQGRSAAPGWHMIRPKPPCSMFTRRSNTAAYFHYIAPLRVAIAL
jgi:hypothetical protein